MSKVSILRKYNDHNNEKEHEKEEEIHDDGFKTQKIQRLADKFTNSLFYITKRSFKNSNCLAICGLWILQFRT